MMWHIRIEGYKTQALHHIFMKFNLVLELCSYKIIYFIILKKMIWEYFIEGFKYVV